VLRSGNRVRLLQDATENYPAWLQAIESATHAIHFESYIVHDDAVGRRFGEALAARARAGVRVRVLYDWWGARGSTSGAFWTRLRDAGADVRCFNPPHLASPLGWTSRDHRKVIVVDGRIAFVSGLCVGQAWLGEPARRIEPWRDTGVEIEGPCVDDVEQAFALTWGAAGPALPHDELPGGGQPRPAGRVAARVIATEPGCAQLYRLDEVLAGAATRTLWLTDAYFVATSRFVDTLRRAANDGVDVRLLVPGVSDVPGLRAVSRAGYRALLEAGIRVFEWNGSMLHAKTAVADSSWALIGSTNLNPASWIGNWELDLLIEDGPMAEQMVRRYQEDLARSTEVVLSDRQHVRPVAASADRGRPRAEGSAGRVAAGAIGAGVTLGVAISARRQVGPAEAQVLAVGGVFLLLLSAAALYWPRMIAVPLAALGLWVGVVLIWDAYRLHGRRQAPEAPEANQHAPGP
jgi:cardiolipin synthase